MARANAAYYASHDPFADFTTAPEISQVFGELLGAWAAVTWQAMGAPTPVILAEAGPGRGTLMADALRAIGQTCRHSARRCDCIWWKLRRGCAPRRPNDCRVPPGTSGSSSLPPGPLLLLGNEFLDALPVRQFVRRGAGWTERSRRGWCVRGGRPTADMGERRRTATVLEQGEAAVPLLRRSRPALRRKAARRCSSITGRSGARPGDSLQAAARRQAGRSARRPRAAPT